MKKKPRPWDPSSGPSSGPLGSVRTLLSGRILDRSQRIASGPLDGLLPDPPAGPVGVR